MKVLSKATILAVFAAAMTVFIPATAHADGYIDYDVTGVFQSGFDLSGWFVLDTTSDMITDGQMTADLQGFTCPDGFGNGCALSTQIAFLVGPGAPTTYSFLQLGWDPGSSPSDFSFDPTLSFCAYCATAGHDTLVQGAAIEFGTDANPVINDAPGTNDDPVNTPEPASGLFLAAGLVGLGFTGLKFRGAINNA